VQARSLWDHAFREALPRGATHYVGKVISHTRPSGRHSYCAWPPIDMQRGHCCLCRVGKMCSVAQRSERSLNSNHSPAARRSPDRKSSRCSGFRRWFAFGIIEEVMDRNRAMISRASSNRFI
jgi:hypothetical protein